MSGGGFCEWRRASPSSTGVSALNKFFPFVGRANTRDRNFLAGGNNYMEQKEAQTLASCLQHMHKCPCAVSEMGVQRR
jgi:hypothetical protein